MKYPSHLLVDPRPATHADASLRFIRLCAALAASMLPLSAIALGDEPQDGQLQSGQLQDGQLQGHEISPQHLDFFESKVRPLLVQHCYECHSTEAGEASGELRVDSAAALAVGGTHGPALVAGKPHDSLLVRVIEYEDVDMQMPPSGKIADQEIAILRRWIEIGAPDPRRGEPLAKSSSPMDRDPKSHWTFVTPERPVAPESASAASRDAIDDWAKAASDAASVAVSKLARDETLVRRLYYDLTGLPAPAETIERYVSSPRPDKYVRLVDQLLAGPEFGERFARHWLDVARYADTLGYATAGKERRYQGSERYRDWTIAAFAADMPYDQMVMHQLAGDRTDPDGSRGNLDAMGFLTLGRKFLNNLDTIDDRIDVVTRGLLGLTVACARCHDHKFDPIPTTDYYAMFGIMDSSRQPEDGASPLMMVDVEKPRDRPVLVRGQRGSRGPIAPRQFLTSLRKPEEPRFNDGSGRYELAQRITAPDNPLTARVMVNRVWGHLIGEPLVDTPSDFGFRTQPPAVPQILDELAVEFAGHWSIKRIVRRIVMTRVYRQSASRDGQANQGDPENRLLARANRKRRDFESLRDSMLCVSGHLDRSMGGPPVEITLGWPTPRRTVYAMIDRQNLPSLFRTFDFAGPDSHSPERYFTTVPQQALFLLNHPQMFTLARDASAGARRDADSQAAADLAVALFRRVLGRLPSDNERAAAIEFLERPVSEIDPVLDERTLWTYGIAKLVGENQDEALEFSPLEVFKNGRWQAADEFPTDQPYGYAYLDPESGHAPNSSSHGVVRRFTSPIDGKVSIQGQFGHRQSQGDGVQVGIWVGGQRKWFENQKSNNRPLRAIRFPIRAGETVDLVTSPGPTPSFDSFFMRMNVSVQAKDGRRIETNTAKHFSGPIGQDPSQPLGRLAQLAQVLMMSNEFAFVD